MFRPYHFLLILLLTSIIFSQNKYEKNVKDFEFNGVKLWDNYDNIIKQFPSFQKIDDDSTPGIKTIGGRIYGQPMSQVMFLFYNDRLMAIQFYYSAEDTHGDPKKIGKNLLTKYGGVTSIEDDNVFYWEFPSIARRLEWKVYPDGEAEFTIIETTLAKKYSENNLQ